MSDQTLFRSIDVFEIDYVPEFFNYRESQLNDLAYQVRPALEGGRALSAICRGLPGTGKTTSVLRIFAELEQTTKKIVPVYVNCQNDRTKYMVFSRVYAAVFGHAPARTGVSIKSVMDAIGGALQRQEKSLIVCLDDANLLHYNNLLGDVVNSLLRLHQDYPGGGFRDGERHGPRPRRRPEQMGPLAVSPLRHLLPALRRRRDPGHPPGPDPDWPLSRRIFGADA